MLCPEAHLRLRVEGGRSGGKQPVSVRPLPDGEFEVLFTPGLVEGVAAGDLIRVTHPESGDFEVTRRGGNLAIKLFRSEPIAPVVDWLLPKLKTMGGRLDGQIDRAAVFTVPVTARSTPSSPR